MSTAFDPYYTWLGIPPAEQPPDHYRLLGLVRFETDPAVIEHAADRQMAHLRAMQTGPQGEASQRLLNEVAAARVCLLDPARKAPYDAQLRERLAQTGQAAGDPQIFDQYVLIDKLDEGRSGRMLKARHATMGRVVALKILSREAMASAQFRERFQRKVRILAQLQHPNLVSAYEAGEYKGMYYLVMEYVDGQDLRTLVKEWGPPPVDKALEYICQAAEGIAYAHRQGVYHRDVKPANLMVDKRGVVKVIGLGLAHVEAESVLSEEGMGELTRQGQIMGTYDYMSPEQAVDSSRVDPRCDIYSLGCSLYAILTGRPPYPGKSPMQQVAAHRGAPIPSLRAARPDVPEFLDAVFQKIVAKRPEDRYQSMDEVLAALRGGVAPAARPVAPAPFVLPPAVPLAPAVMPVAPAVIPLGPGGMPVAGGAPVDFAGGAKPVSATSRPGAPRPSRTSARSGGLKNPMIRFFVIGSLALLAVVVGLLVWSGRQSGDPAEEEEPLEETVAAAPDEAPAAKQERPTEPKEPDFPAMTGKFEEPKLKLGFGQPEPVATKSAQKKAKPAAPRPAKAKESGAGQAQGAKPPAPEAETASAKQPVKEPAVKVPAAKEPAAKAGGEEKAPAGRRSPALSDEELAAATEPLREKFKDDLAEAEESEAKLALSQRLTERAKEMRDDPKARYACLMMAVDLAVEAGRPTVAFEGIDRIAEEFDVDIVSMKAKIVSELVRTARTPVQHTAAARHALSVTEAALEAGEYELAGRTGRLAQTESTRSRDAELAQKVRAVMKDVQQALKEVRQLEEAQELIKKQPADAEANLVVGRHECLIKGRWTEGLRHLSAGSDAALRELAKTDLSGPSDPEARVALADLWWDLGEKETGPAKRNLRLRAASWYEKALPQLTDLVKMKAQRRLETAAGSPKKSP